MAVTKSILKNNRQEFAVHLVGTTSGDTTSIALTELVRSDETTSGTLQVGIQSIQYGTEAGKVITLSRSGTVVTYLTDNNNVIDFSGIGMTIASASPIQVTFEGRGWIMMNLHKKAGYVEPLTNVGV